MDVIIVGGSIAGLITSLALSRDGHNVTILEKHAIQMPNTPDEAFDVWNRQGSPQVMHSHAFLGRMHNMIRDHEPELLRKLIENGAEELKFESSARQYFEDPEFEPGDDDIVLLACRRITFEWVLRKHVLDTGLVNFRDGVEVTGLIAERDVQSDLPRVTGVTLVEDGGEQQDLKADLVVDSSGRRGSLGDWLEAIGARKLEEVKSETGIFYATRFYRLLDGQERPRDDGFAGGDLGYVKFGIFPADGGTFSITLAAAPDDDPMRAVLRTDGFDRVAQAIPMVSEWVSPSVSTPITDASGMANLNNAHRVTVQEDEPLALGLVPIGDARVHANPLTGRGCTLAWICAYALADALREHPDDLRAVALDVNSVVLRDCAPWLEAQMRSDVDAIAVNKMQREGKDPYKTENEDGTTNPEAYRRAVMREGLGPASREDLGLMRAISRIAHMLDVPSDLTKKPEVMQKILESYETRHDRPPRVQGPSREEMLEILAG